MSRTNFGRIPLRIPVFLLIILFLFVCYNLFQTNHPQTKQPEPDYLEPNHLEVNNLETNYLETNPPKTIDLETNPPDPNLPCFYMKHETLEDISEGPQPTERSIFFLETSCNSHKQGKIVIRGRQACAVESAAKLNPNYQIYLLYVSPGVLKFKDTESDKFLQALLSYDNVHIKHIDFDTYFKGTLVENLYKEKKIENSQYPMQHASDVLRFLTLWKYGGIYLDLDTIVIKSLEELPFNFAGVESTDLVASAILSFSRGGAGHDFVTMCLEDLHNNFSGIEWARNGPVVITKLSQKLCNTDRVDQLVNSTCSENYRVYPTKTFCPIPYWQWEKYFNEGSVEEVEALTKDSYVLHIWNKMSGERKLPIGVNAPYTNFAKQYCPKVFSECKEYF